MKQFIFTLSIVAVMTLFTSCDASIKESDVPAAVKTSFNAKYPGATKTEWKKEKTDGKDVFEAMFNLNGKDVEAEFLPDGTFYKED